MPGFWETLKNNPALWSAPTLNRAYEDQQMLSAYEKKLKIAQKLEEEAAERIESRRVLDRASGEWIILNRFGKEIRKERATPDEIAMQTATVGKAGSEANRAESEATRAKEMLPGGKIWGEEQRVRDANIKQSNASTAAQYQSITRDKEAISDNDRKEADELTSLVSNAAGLAESWLESAQQDPNMPADPIAVAKAKKLEDEREQLQADYDTYIQVADPNSQAAKAKRRALIAKAERLKTMALQAKDKVSPRGAINPYGMGALGPMTPTNPGFNPTE